ncbi:uncharacterized protein LAJ45_10720 [Morchella importuna]|nr:uncharacterized protein LAJ45_10720 [Morchella importuna]KAH8145283.1 hypothetical protein LAJ45_10720 [Morchella importuna]
MLNSTRYILNRQMRSTVEDLVTLHRSLYFLQFMLRSLYRRVARTMTTNIAAPNRVRLAKRAVSQRDTHTSLRAHFSLHEARGLIMLDFAANAIRSWNQMPGVTVDGAGVRSFPRVFGRSERRMYILVQRLMDQHEAMYSSVGLMLRDFYAFTSPFYCGMQ